MDSHSTTLILILIVLVALSAYFSATETAFSSLNRIRLKNLAAGGNKRAKLAYALSENYDELLSTILVGNNIVNIASASIATVLFVNALGEGIGPTVSTVVMTVIVLIFGEVSPKSLAKESAESFAMFSSPIIRVLIVVLKPVNFLFTQLKKGLKRLSRSAATIPLPTASCSPLWKRLSRKAALIKTREPCSAMSLSSTTSRPSTS